ncbi:hypothetical protein Tco_0463728, partial [Tanacetum coccineum]
GQYSNANAMEDDDVDAATHMELDDDVDSEEEEVPRGEKVPNEFAQRFYGFKDNDEPLYAGCQN